jgi:hypothetical protein
LNPEPYTLNPELLNFKPPPSTTTLINFKPLTLKVLRLAAAKAKAEAEAVKLTRARYEEAAELARNKADAEAATKARTEEAAKKRAAAKAAKEETVAAECSAARGGGDGAATFGGGGEGSDDDDDDDDDDGDLKKLLESKKEKKKAKKDRRRVEKRAVAVAANGGGGGRGGGMDSGAHYASGGPGGEGVDNVGAESLSSVATVGDIATDATSAAYSLQHQASRVSNIPISGAFVDGREGAHNHDRGGGPRGGSTGTRGANSQQQKLTSEPTRMSLMDRLRAARRIHVLDLPRDATAAALKAYLSAALGPSHGAGVVLGSTVRPLRGADADANVRGGGADDVGVKDGALLGVVELSTAAAAASALNLNDARAPGGGALRFRPAPDAPLMTEPAADVTEALDVAIAAGSLSGNDIDDDVWEALHLVDPVAAVDALLALAAVGRAAAIVGGGGAALIAVLDRREVELRQVLPDAYVGFTGSTPGGFGSVDGGVGRGRRGLSATQPTSGGEGGSARASASQAPLSNTRSSQLEGDGEVGGRGGGRGGVASGAGAGGVGGKLRSSSPATDSGDPRP